MISSTAAAFSSNRILSALPVSDYQKLKSHLEPVKFKHGEIVYQPDEPIKYVYFPETCVFSQLTVFKDGSSIESGIIGSEGVAGISVILSPSNAARETCVQTSGRGLRIETEAFREAFENRAARDIVFQFGSVFFEQVAQAGACSNHHPANQRLARLLLMFHDRVDGDSFFITHESIAQMLGIHRPSVTIAALELKNKGLIDYSRGVIRIKNRAALEAEACECYELISRIYRTYNEILEIRRLDQRMEEVKQRLLTEVERRHGLKNIASQNIGWLQRAVIDTRSARHSFSVCVECHHVRDEYGSWLAVEDFLKTHFKAKTSTCLCPDCKK